MKDNYNHLYPLSRPISMQSSKDKTQNKHNFSKTLKIMLKKNIFERILILKQTRITLANKNYCALYLKIANGY